MKKFITFLSIISSLIFLSFFVKPQLVHADEKTYTIATDVTFPPFEYAATRKESSYKNRDFRCGLC